MSVFDSSDNQAQESHLDQLVKAKGEQWKDPEVLAKGKLEADRYIEELKAQVEQFSSDQSRVEKLEALMAKLEEKAGEPATPKTQVSDDSGATDPDTTVNVDEDHIQSLVEKTITQREQLNTVKQNVDAVNKKLAELYGDDAKANMEKVASELGMSMDRMEELAGQSPKAFFKLTGLEDGDDSGGSMTESTIRTDSLPSSRGSKKNNSYYQKMRRENPHKFNSAEIQNEMVQQAMKLGDDFFN